VNVEEEELGRLAGPCDRDLVVARLGAEITHGLQWAFAPPTIDLQQQSSLLLQRKHTWLDQRARGYEDRQQKWRRLTD